MCKVNGDLISREAAKEVVKYIPWCDWQAVGRTLDELPDVEITGDTSDGYHTFNELYHHRAVLFSVICKAFPDKVWKSKQHHDGTMYDGMFIVGIDTPDGQATYHYDIELYWDMFDCLEVDYAPEWDGHTPAQAIERIGKLEPVVHGRWKSQKVYKFIAVGVSIPYCDKYYCSECKTEPPLGMQCNYCPNCGAKMDGEEV